MSAQLALSFDPAPRRVETPAALATDLDRYMLARRLPECETGRAVKRGEPKRCSVSGKLAMAWWPV